jgi:hypothetical protein
MCSASHAGSAVMESDAGGRYRWRCLWPVMIRSLLLSVGLGTWVVAACKDIPALTRLGPDTAPVVIYNRIPKCGSTTMINLLRHHGKWSGRYYGFNDSPNMFMEKPFETNTSWTSGWKGLREQIELAGTANHLPLLYMNHIYWTNFSEAGVQSPATYIQLIREPVGRVVSAFYYLMLGPRQEERMLKSQHRAMNLLSLDHPPTINEYVTIIANSLTDPMVCMSGTLQSETKGNLMTRYFCGFDPVCADICSPEAFERAKYILSTQYTWVGILEDLETSLQQLERIGPDWFDGLVESYHNNSRTDQQKTRVTIASKKSTYGTLKYEPPTKRSSTLLQAWNSQDMKLYKFAKQHLKHQIEECTRTGTS